MVKPTGFVVRMMCPCASTQVLPRMPPAPAFMSIRKARTVSKRTGTQAMTVES